MKKNKILGCISLICFAPFTFAMQPLDDQSLSATTGQDGINIGVGINKVQFNQVSLIDTDGIASSATYNNRASFVIANSNSATPVTLNFNGGNSTSTFNIVADSDGGANNKAFANLAISFANQITGLTISPFSIYLAGTNSTSSSTG